MAIGFLNNCQIPNYRLRHIFSSLSLNFEPRTSKRSEKPSFTSSHNYNKDSRYSDRKKNRFRVFGENNRF